MRAVPMFFLSSTARRYTTLPLVILPGAASHPNMTRVYPVNAPLSPTRVRGTVAIDHPANGLRIRTPGISCPSFKSSAYSTAAPVRAAATPSGATPSDLTVEPRQR
jgi:hypothetical protein